MRIIHGIAVSPGIAIGEAFVHENERIRVPFRRISETDVPSEIARFEAAVEDVAVEIEQRSRVVTEELGPQSGAIFTAHLQMLRDPQLHRAIRESVTREQCSIEYAVSRVLRRFAQVFRKSDSQYMSERAQDIYDIEKLLLVQLLGKRSEELSQWATPVILLSLELTPSETANLSKDKVLGFVTERGGPGGHVAIMAEALEIPAVVGTGDFLSDVSGGEMIIVDGDEGCVIIDPDEETIARYRESAAEHDAWMTQLESMRELPAVTIDGEKIELAANIEFPHEADSVVRRGVSGIGLYRTEFLYLGKQCEPSEEEQVRAYREVGQAMRGRPVVIRTLDLGADKLSETMKSSHKEPNPFLGLRSIRLSLRHPGIFRRQLRAILRASTDGNLRIMFPLVSTVDEWEQAVETLEEVKSELDEAGVPYDPNIPVGIMVEVPAAVLMLDRFLDRVDFISIGTNDLVQYTLAVDRSNEDVAALYSNGDPAVLRLIRMTCDGAARSNVPVSLCGQMAADPKYVILLLGFGLRKFSISPSAVYSVKRICRSVSVDQCRVVAERAMELDTAGQVRDYLRAMLQELVPDFSPTLSRRATAAIVAKHEMN